MDSRVPALAAFALLLAGCGGGSSNSGAPMAPAPMGDIVVVDDAYTLYVPPGFAQPYTQQFMVLDNDSAPVGDTLTLVGVGNPAHGTTTFQADCALHPQIIPSPPPAPCVSYSSNVGFVGADEFTYTVQDLANRTATGRVTVTVNNQYLLHGCVNAPAGSIHATQVGFADQDARVQIAADGCFDLAMDVGSMSIKLVADSPNTAPSLTARLGAAGEAVPLPTGVDPMAPTNLRLNAFSTAEEAVLSAPPDPSYSEGAPIDWLGIFERATLIQLALEAGGVSAGFPPPVTIATDAQIRAQLHDRFGDTAIAQRQALMLDEGDLAPLIPPPLSPISIVAFDGDIAAWNDVLLVRFIGRASARYVTAFGGGDATWRVAGNEIVVTPSSGPSADIGNIGLRFVGNPGDFRFGVSLRSNGRLGSHLWNGERSPDLYPSGYPDGLQTAGFALIVFPAFSETVHRLPVCFLPAGANPPSEHTFGFHNDPTGTVLGSGAQFTWLQSAGLSMRYEPDMVATYIALARFADRSMRVIADESFDSGDELLCEGHDILQP
jgi:hypothetical protein